MTPGTEKTSPIHKSAATALLIIDLQNAYFNNEALQRKRATLLKKTNELIAIAQQFHLPIFNVRTEHQHDTGTWTLNMLDDEQGYLFKGESDSQSIEGLNTKNAIEVLKTRDSAFHNTTLAAMLKNHRVETVIVCGVSTHTCIAQTAADAYSYNFRVILAKEAIASHLPKFHDNALELLKTEYRQQVASHATLKQYVKDNS